MAPRKAKSGCAIALTILGVVAGLISLCVVLVVVGLVGLYQRLNAPPPPATRPVPVATIPKAAPTAQSAYAKGACMHSDDERGANTSYIATRQSGSAAELRGKVAILHVRIGGGDAAWPRPLVARVDEGALMAERFFLEQAARRGIGLTVDSIPLNMHNAPFASPPLIVQRSQVFSPATSDALVRSSTKAVESSLGSKLPSVIQSYRNKGYSGVAFLFYFPAVTSGRAFAVPSGRESNTVPEMAIIFPQAPRQASMHFPVTVAHEALHLFGADDLYRVGRVDKRDDKDVMNDYCHGFRETTIGDMTAYAIGWLSTKPDRPYRVDSPGITITVQ